MKNKRRQLVAAPPPSEMPAAERLQHDVRGMGVLPARVVPDQWLNLRSVGLHYTLTPRGGPVTVPAGGATVTARLTTSDRFAHMILQAVAVILDASQQPATVDESFPLVVRMKDAASRFFYDNDFMHVRTIFGIGYYPANLAMPRVLPPNTTWVMQWRNYDAVRDCIVIPEFRTLRRYLGDGGK